MPQGQNSTGVSPDGDHSLQHGLGRGKQRVDPLTQFVRSISDAVEAFEDDVVPGDEERDGLIRHAVEVPYRVVETPLHVRDELRGYVRGFSETRTTGDGNEPDPIPVLGCDLIDDG